MADDVRKIEPHRKAVVIENGAITRMYWDHSQHKPERDGIDHNHVLARWRELHPTANYTSGEFLRKMGFAIVIIDGQLMPEEWGRKARR